MARFRTAVNCKPRNGMKCGNTTEDPSGICHIHRHIPGASSAPLKRRLSISPPSPDQPQVDVVEDLVEDLASSAQRTLGRTRGVDHSAVVIGGGVPTDLTEEEADRVVASVQVRLDLTKQEGRDMKQFLLERRDQNRRASGEAILVPEKRSLISRMLGR